MALKMFEGAGSLARQATRREGQAVASGQIYDQAQADARKAGEQERRKTAGQLQGVTNAIQAMGAQSPGRAAALARQLGGNLGNVAAGAAAAASKMYGAIAEQRRQAVQAQLERQQERNRQTREALVKGTVGLAAGALDPAGVSAKALKGALGQFDDDDDE